jgi:hypothetical protein
MATILRPFLIDASLFLSCSSLVVELAKEIGRGAKYMCLREKCSKFSLLSPVIYFLQ